MRETRTLWMKETGRLSTWYSTSLPPVISKLSTTTEVADLILDWARRWTLSFRRSPYLWQPWMKPNSTRCLSFSKMGRVSATHHKAVWVSRTPLKVAWKSTLTQTTVSTLILCSSIHSLNLSSIATRWATSRQSWWDLRLQQLPPITARLSKRMFRAT